MLPSLPGICGGGLATPLVLMAHNRTLSMLSWTFQVPRFGFQGNSTVITVDYSMTTRSLSITQNYHTHPSAKQYNVKLSWWGSYLLWFVDLVPITCGYQKPTLQWTRLSGQNWWMDPERGHVNQLGKELPSHSTTANAEVTLWRRARSTVEKLGTHCRHNHQTWDGRGFDIWVWLPESPIHKTNLDSDCWCHSIHDEDLMHSIVQNTLKFVTTNWATMTVHFTLLTGYIFVNYWAAYTEWVIISVHWLSNGNSKG